MRARGMYRREAESLSGDIGRRESSVQARCGTKNLTQGKRHDAQKHYGNCGTAQGQVG
jgi:hypothetical protein